MINFVVIIAEKSTTHEKFSDFDEFLVKKKASSKFSAKDKKSRTSLNNQ
jgi:hypothetical protein